jgi:hypothetical protein
LVRSSFFAFRFSPGVVKRANEDLPYKYKLRMWMIAALLSAVAIMVYIAVRNGLTDRATWILAQCLAGAMVGAAVAFVWQHFSELWLGQSPPKLDFIYHVWLSASLAILILIGVLGPETKGLFSRISNLNVGAVSVQIDLSP